MKITVYFNSSYPYGAASTNRVHQLCKGLKNNEVDVKLIITNPTERTADTRNDQIEGIYEGVRYKYLSKTTHRAKGLIVRKLNDFGCYLLTYWHILFSVTRNDAIIVIGGATFDFRILIPILARIVRKNVYLEINEYPFVTRKEGLRKTFMLFIFFRIVVPAYNGFIVISELLSKEIGKFKSKSARIIKIPIISEEQKLDTLSMVPPYSLPYIIHSGSMIEQKDGIIGSLQAFAKVREEFGLKIIYLLAGNQALSPQIDSIKQFIKIEGLEDSVFFLGLLNRADLTYYYRHAKLAIVNKSHNKQNEYCFATKISDYIAYGIPMILTKVGEISNYFEHDYNAILVEPDNVDQIANAIERLVNDGELAEKLAKNAKSLLEKDFNTDVNGARLRDFIASDLNRY